MCLQLLHGADVARECGLEKCHVGVYFHFGKIMVAHQVSSTCRVLGFGFNTSSVKLGLPLLLYNWIKWQRIQWQTLCLGDPW